MPPAEEPSGDKPSKPARNAAARPLPDELAAASAASHLGAAPCQRVERAAPNRAREPAVANSPACPESPCPPSAQAFSSCTTPTSSPPRHATCSVGATRSGKVGSRPSQPRLGAASSPSGTTHFTLHQPIEWCRVRARQRFAEQQVARDRCTRERTRPEEVVRCSRPGARLRLRRTVRIGPPRACRSAPGTAGGGLPVRSDARGAARAGRRCSRFHGLRRAARPGACPSRAPAARRGAPEAWPRRVWSPRRGRRAWRA